MPGAVTRQFGAALKLVRSSELKKKRAYQDLTGNHTFSFIFTREWCPFHSIFDIVLSICKPSLLFNDMASRFGIMSFQVMFFEIYFMYLPDTF